MTSHTPHNEEKDDWEKKLLGEVLYEGRLVRRHVDASRAWVKNKLAPLVYDVIRQERQRLIDEVMMIVGEDENEVKLQEKDAKLGISRYYVITAEQKRRNQFRSELREKLQALR